MLRAVQTIASNIRKVGLIMKATSHIIISALAMRHCKQIKQSSNHQARGSATATTVNKWCWGQTGYHRDFGSTDGSKVPELLRTKHNQYTNPERISESQKTVFFASFNEQSAGCTR